MGQPIKKEVAVLVRVSKDTDGDRFGGIGAIAETVTDGLTERKIANQLYAADDDHPGTPRIEIWVTHWGAGNANLRASGRVVGVGAGVLGGVMQLAGRGDYEVIVKIFRDGDSEPVCVRRHFGMVDPDDAGATVSAGERVGSAILSDALRDTPECPVTDPASKHRPR